MKLTFQYSLMFTALFLVAFFSSSILSNAPLKANTAPNYGTMPFSVGLFSSTTDGDILSAPGEDKRWVITGIAWNVLVENADSIVLVQDKAGSPQNIVEFGSETQGFGQYIDFEQGISCHQNSGVEVDLSASTADVWIMVTAYIQRMQ